MEMIYTRIASFISIIILVTAFQCRNMDKEFEAMAVQNNCRFQCDNEKIVSSFSKLTGKVVKIPITSTTKNKDPQYIYGITIHSPDFTDDSYTRNNILLPCETFPEKFLENNLMVVIEGKLTNCCGLLKAPDTGKRFGCKIILNSIIKK